MSEKRVDWQPEPDHDKALRECENWFSGDPIAIIDEDNLAAAYLDLRDQIERMQAEGEKWGRQMLDRLRKAAGNGSLQGS